MADKLVMVDKDKLRTGRDNLRKTVEIARKSDSLATAWFLLGALVAAVDELYTELCDGHEISP
jgi:hypothetical protein